MSTALSVVLALPAFWIFAALSTGAWWLVRRVSEHLATIDRIGSQRA